RLDEAHALKPRSDSAKEDSALEQRSGSAKEDGAMNGLSPIGQVALQFLLLSVLAIGGVNAVTPEIQRQVVDLRHWMSAREFAEMFAVAQATPGPNLLIAT